jgi:multiple sugar transport system substrate-binding protein
MNREFRPVSRRTMLRVGALLVGASALPLLQACGGQQATPTAAPAATTAPAPTQAAQPTVAPTKAAAAAPTTVPTTAPTAAPTTQATAAATPQANAAATPNASYNPNAPVVFDASKAKVTGQFTVVQQKDWNPIHNDYLHKLVQDWAQKYNFPLNLYYEAGFTGGTNFNQKMAAAVSSGTGPDMLWGAYDTFTLWYLKTLQPVDDVVQAMVKKFGDPTPGFGPPNKVDGKWYAVPYFNRTGGNWARKSWFQDKGIDITTLNDFDQWKEAALEVSDASKRQWGWGETVNRSGDGETDVSWPWFEAGNRLTDETGTKVFFNTDLSIQAFNWLKDLYTNPKWKPMMPPGVLAWDDMGNNNAWAAGTIGFTNNAGTIFAAEQKTAPDTIGKDTYLVQQPAMPIGEKQRLVGAGGGATFYIMQGAKNPDAAKALIEYMLTADQQTKLFGYTPGYVAPAYAWGWDTDPVKNCVNGVDLIFKKNAFDRNAFSWYMPAPQTLLWVNGVSSAVVFTDTMAAILKGTSVKDAVNEGQQKIEAIGKKFNWK